MKELHLIPQIIFDIVDNLNNSNKYTSLTYEKRLEVIRDYINEQLTKYRNNISFK